jgi:uncharacterized protein
MSSRAVLWDSSAMLALLNRDDASHRTALQIAGRLADQRRPAVITRYIEAETHALLLRKLGREPALRWLLTVSFDVSPVRDHDVEAAKLLLEQYDDKDWSLCDAVSFAWMIRNRVRTAFSFDHHFGQIGRFEVLGLKR